MEGEKQVRDILHYSPDIIELLVISEGYSGSPFNEISTVSMATSTDFREMSSMTHPQGVMAVCRMPREYFNHHWEGNGFALYFDGIQDPGNLGTMFRAAEWFGIGQVLIGPDTVDPFSPKVVQAAMGSLVYLDIYSCTHDALNHMNCPLLVADLDGQDAYHFEWPESGMLIMSNEGQGVSPFVDNLAITRITLPSLASSRTESLNVSMACTALLTLRSASR